MRQIAVICRNLDLEYLIVRSSVPFIPVKDTVPDTIRQWMISNVISGNLMGKIADVTERDFVTGQPIIISALFCTDCIVKFGANGEWIPYYRLKETVRGYGWIKYIQMGGEMVDITVPHQVDLRCTTQSEIDAELKYCEELNLSNVSEKGKIYLKKQLSILNANKNQEIRSF
jgi:hypothetical protein